MRENKLYFYISFNDYLANKIFSEMIEKIYNSGLGHNCKSVNLCIAGDIKYLDWSILGGGKKYNLIQVRNSYEYDAIDMIWNDCQKENINVCYVHAKGITRPDNECTSDWRKYMSYFMIEKWEDRVKDLVDCDCTGVNLIGNREDYLESPSTWGHTKAPIHYSGNYWWSKSEHIKQLKKPSEFWPSDDYKKWRVVPEMWLCQLADSKYCCAWQSNVNHYHERYTEENYI
jgi:hypothetical protein